MDLTVVNLGKLLVSHLSQPVVAGTQTVLAVTQTVIAATQTVIAGLTMLTRRGVLERRAELIH